MLTKEEKAISRPRRCVKGHYFDGLFWGFGAGALGGSLLFRDSFVIYIAGAIAIIFYLSTDYLEKKSYNQIKDVLTRREIEE